MYTYFQRPRPSGIDRVRRAGWDSGVYAARAVEHPLQALTLLNDEAYVEFATELSACIRKQAATDAERLRLGYEYALARDPKPAEQERFVRFIQARRDAVAGGASDEKAGTQCARC
jgi:hypothetical protein